METKINQMLGPVIGSIGIIYGAIAMLWLGLDVFNSIVIIFLGLGTMYAKD